MPMSGRTFSPADPDPTPLTAVPEVQAALQRLTEANERWHTCMAREAAARAAAERAPQEDASAAILAVESGSKLPPVTAAKAEAQAEEAHRVRIAAESLCLRAEEDLLAAIDTHREPLRAAQRDRLETALDDVERLLGEAQAAMTAAGLEAARLVNVGNEEYGHPLSTPMPMQWMLFDPRADATVDARISLDLIAAYATDMRPSVIDERQLRAETEWQQTIAGENPRYNPHKAPDGQKMWVRT